jgi:hypothetical protein
MTRYLDNNAGKCLPEQIKSWNALKDIYTWRVYYKYGSEEIEWHDHLGTQQEAMQVVIDNTDEFSIVNVEKWHTGMPEHELTDLDDQ